MSNQKSKKPQLNGSNGANRAKPTIGAYFLSLELENVRCFSEKQVLDLSDGQGRPARWTILLGENGTGKTTVLQFLAAFERPPKCYAYGTARRLGAPSLNPDEANSMNESLFFEDMNLLNAEEWLLRLDYSASKRSKIQEQQKQRLVMAKDVLTRVLPDVAAIRFTSPTNEKPTPAVEFETPYGWVPLRQLGYGYRTMIAWVVDFTSRMIDRYTKSPDPLAEPAVVLVDEIDLHLHPKWQRELIGFLTDRFPNTQFIVTAHSPLIVQAATDANLVLLRREGDHVVIENSPEKIRGWRVDQILTSELFGLNTARPPDTEKLMMRRKELLTRSRLTRATQKELEEINAKLGSIPTGESFEQARTMAVIEKSLEMLKKNQSTNP